MSATFIQQLNDQIVQFFFKLEMNRTEHSYFFIFSINNNNYYLHNKTDCVTIILYIWFVTNIYNEWMNEWGKKWNGRFIKIVIVIRPFGFLHLFAFPSHWMTLIQSNEMWTFILFYFILFLSSFVQCSNGESLLPYPLLTSQNWSLTVVLLAWLLVLMVLVVAETSFVCRRTCSILFNDRLANTIRSS